MTQSGGVLLENHNLGVVFPGEHHGYHDVLGSFYWISEVTLHHASPLFIACAGGHTHVVEYLLKQGGVSTLDLSLGGISPLQVAEKHGDAQLLSLLRELDLHALPPEEPAAQPKRRNCSMFERAQAAGVADRLKPIPASLETALASESISKEEKGIAKKALHKIQKSNQKVVSRAEAARLRQSKLSF